MKLFSVFILFVCLYVCLSGIFRHVKYVCLSMCVTTFLKVSSSIWIRFLLLFLVLTLFPFFSLPLGMPIESEVMDRFLHSRCLYIHINIFYMIGSFANGTNVSLVAKNGTKRNILLLSIKSSLVDRFQSLRYLNDHIHLLYMMGSLTSGTTNSLVAKIGTKDFATSCLVYRFWTNGRFLMFKVSKWLYRSVRHDEIIFRWRHNPPGGENLN